MVPGHHSTRGPRFARSRWCPPKVVWTDRSVYCNSRGVETSRVRGGGARSAALGAEDDDSTGHGGSHGVAARRNQVLPRPLWPQDDLSAIDRAPPVHAVGPRLRAAALQVGHSHGLQSGQYPSSWEPVAGTPSTICEVPGSARVRSTT